AMAGNFFFRQKFTDARQWDAENGEIVGGDDGTERAPRIAFLADADQCEIESHYVGEHRVLLANVEISGVGKTTEFLGILLVLRKELHHFMRFGITRGGKENCVHQGEYGGIHANAEREHRYRCNRKGWRLEQLAERKFKITNHGQVLSHDHRVGSGCATNWDVTG